MEVGVMAHKDLKVPLGQQADHKEHKDPQALRVHPAPRAQSAIRDHKVQ
jgi:hypothetical protein